ncbi:MAG TPA: hypothetical protein VFQ55_13630 [Casimicrobiaceae bacterium]|nr:hypothetical protein [Casimicrobiaceae bacterium]
MDTIIAGRYDGFEAAEKGRERLEACGFPQSSIRVFVDLGRGRGVRRPVRVTVAVHLGESDRDDDAIHVLGATGATSIERAQGEWRDAAALANEALFGVQPGGFARRGGAVPINAG